VAGAATISQSKADGGRRRLCAARALRGRRMWRRRWEWEHGEGLEEVAGGALARHGAATLGEEVMGRDSRGTSCL
jgi:hypothetical protein